MKVKIAYRSLDNTGLYQRQIIQTWENPAHEPVKEVTYSDDWISVILSGRIVRFARKRVIWIDEMDR